MTRDEVLAKLRADKPALDAFGVSRIGVFGSVARGEADADSDVDVVVDFLPGHTPSLVGISRLRFHLEDLLGRPVDLAMPGSANKRVDEVLRRESVYA